VSDDRRLIEVAFPLKQASLDSVHEKMCHAGHPKSIHSWPARRPLAASRAALIAALLPDPGDPEARKQILERMAGRVVEKIERKKVGGRVVEKVKEETVGGILHWGRENGPDLDWFRQEIRKAYGGRAPKVLDPFAGGGAIPLEAMRLGCEVTAIDINPVAWFILKCTLEYPQKLAGQTRPLPEFALKDREFIEAFLKTKGFKGAGLRTMLERLGHGDGGEIQLDALPPDDPTLHADLAWHVRAWGRWVLAEARKELAPYYPTYAEFDLPAASRRAAAQAGPLDRLPISRPAYRGAGGSAETFYTYVLQCSDGSFYIGQTDNLRRRFAEHESGNISWTAPRRPLRLLHWEEFKSREEAVKREHDLKTGFGRKWIKREFEADRLRAQQYEGLRLLEVDENGIPQLDPLNAEFDEAYLKDPQNPRWVAKPTVAYLWARTVTCKNCRATVPLLKTRWLCKKDNKRVLLTMEPNADRTGVVFGVQTNVPQNGGNAAQRRENDKRLGAGTMSRTGAKCRCCGTFMTMEDLRLEGRAKRIGSVLYAVVTRGTNGKEFRTPTEVESNTVSNPRLANDLSKIVGSTKGLLPAFDNPDALGFRVPLYGIAAWNELFNARQLLVLGTICSQIQKLGAQRNVIQPEWLEAITAYLACSLSKCADYNSAFVAWQPAGAKGANTFQRWALPIKWDFTENNIVESDSGGFLGICDWIAQPLGNALAEAFYECPPPSVKRRSAVHMIDGSYDLIVTDPPYYDAIAYADLMDFFYVWIRKCVSNLNNEYKEIFQEELTPKWNHDKEDGELIDDASRFEGDKYVSKQTYENGMYNAFKQCFSVLNDQGHLVIVFANKNPDAWETLVAALVRAGFVVDASWPIQTEMGNRTRAMASAALASSVWLVCRKRTNVRPGWDTAVLNEMRANITQKLREFWDAGIRGPDFVWAATGPALEAFSKYPVVKKANDPNRLMTVSEFLREVRRMVVDFVVGRVLTQDGGEEVVTGLDDVTTYYLLHRHDFGMDEAPIGACILYALSCNLSDSALVNQYDLLVQSGKSSTREEDEEEETIEDTDEDSGGGSGAKVKLKAWNRRRGRSLGLEAPGGRPVPLIDQVHKLMHLWRAGDQAKVDDYLETRGLKRNALFNQILQALIELAAAGSDERSILESLSNHVAARERIGAPRQGRLV